MFLLKVLENKIYLKLKLRKALKIELGKRFIKKQNNQKWLKVFIYLKITPYS